MCKAAANFFRCSIPTEMKRIFSGVPDREIAIIFIPASEIHTTAKQMGVCLLEHLSALLNLVTVHMGEKSELHVH